MDTLDCGDGIRNHKRWQSGGVYLKDYRFTSSANQEMWIYIDNMHVWKYLEVLTAWHKRIYK